MNVEILKEQTPNQTSYQAQIDKAIAANKISVEWLAIIDIKLIWTFISQQLLRDDCFDAFPNGVNLASRKDRISELRMYYL